MKKAFLLSLLLSGSAFADTFDFFEPATGILVGTSTSYQTTAADSSDIISLWSGTCDMTTFLRADGSCEAPAGGVSSVGLSMPTGFSVSGSPVTSSGTLTVSTTLNGPVRGNGSGLITGNTSLATEVTGTLPVANGGTNLTSAADDEVMVGSGTAWVSTELPSCSGSTNALAYNTSTNEFSCNTIPAGTVTSVGLTVPSGLSVSGSPVTGSGTLAVTTSLNGVVKGNGSGFSASAVNLASEVTGTLPVANGGTGTTTSTGSGSVVLSGSPTLTGTVTADTVAATSVTVGGNAVCQSTGTNCPSGLTARLAWVGNTGGPESCTTVTANSHGFDGCTRTGTGSWTFTLSPTLDAHTVCVASNTQDADIIMAARGSDGSSVIVRAYDAEGTLTDTIFGLMCISN
jgi:hypothetical protein